MPLMTYVYVLSSEAWLRDRHMPLTPRERDILTRMAAAERVRNAGGDEEPYTETELTFSKGGGWWFGLEKVSARVALSLVYRAYITREVGRDEADDYRVYVINGDGRKAVGSEQPAQRVRSA